MSITVSEYCHPLFIVMGVDDTPKIIMNYLGMAKVTISSFHIHIPGQSKSITDLNMLLIAGYLAYYFHWASFMYENMSSCMVQRCSPSRGSSSPNLTMMCRYISTSIIILPFQFQGISIHIHP